MILHLAEEKPGLAAEDTKIESCDWFDLVFQEDHNPKFNGIEILLSHKKRKAAYMLMEMGKEYLCFRGIRIIDNFRRLGLTSTLLKVWLLICAILKKAPTTIKINIQQETVPYGTPNKFPAKNSKCWNKFISKHFNQIKMSEIC